MSLGHVTPFEGDVFAFLEDRCIRPTARSARGGDTLKVDMDRETWFERHADASAHGVP